MILSVFLVDLSVNLPNGRKMEQLFYLVNQTRVGNKSGKGKTNLIYAVGVKIAGRAPNSTPHFTIQCVLCQDF